MSFFLSVLISDSYALVALLGLTGGAWLIRGLKGLSKLGLLPSRLCQMASVFRSGFLT
jgi:hypothetical protein